mgnify:CR=1 FL=1
MTNLLGLSSSDDLSFEEYCDQNVDKDQQELYHKHLSTHKQMFWNNKAARDYQVEGIPTNFLIDANGVIIAKNLRGSGLHLALDKVVEKL